MSEKPSVNSGRLAPDYFLYKYSVPDQETGSMLDVYVCRDCGSLVAGLSWLNIHHRTHASDSGINS